MARTFRQISAFSSLLLLVSSAQAFFFIVPIPNLSKPDPLNRIIKALEKSTETKALAFTSEDKTFGSKQWVWGYFTGRVSQAEADRIALSRCQGSLDSAKSQSAGGRSLYKFGSRVCELYEFRHKSLSLPEGDSTDQSTNAVTPVSEPASGFGSSASAENKTENTKQEGPAGTTKESPPTVPPVAATPPVAISSGATSSSNAPPQIPSEDQTARKLRALDELKRSGLISESEYKEKRRSILSSM